MTLLQDATLREGPAGPGACRFRPAAAAAFLAAARQLPLHSFDVEPHARDLLEALGCAGACSSDSVKVLEGLGGLATERLLHLDLPFNWAALEQAARRLAPLTLIVARAGRLDPILLARLFREAGRWGCRGIVLSDEHSEIGPHGVGYLVRFARRLVVDMQLSLELTWACGNRYGTALAQALEAIEAGIDRIRGTALGVGPHGAVPLDQLLVNLETGSLGELPLYTRRAALGLGLEVPAHYPVVGQDAFRTSVEGAAPSWLQPERYGLAVTLGVGPYSGPAHVRAWLEANGLPPDPELVARLLALAQASSSHLSDLQLLHAAGVEL